MRVQGPFGEFVLDQSNQPLVFIAGGIGITPFISMLRYATEHGLRRQIVLLFSNRNAENIPFKTELLEHAKRNPFFKPFFFSDTPGGNTSVKNERITTDYIQELFGQRLSLQRFYICGPQGMMTALGTGLQKSGVDPDDIVTESFSSSASKAGSGLSGAKKTYAVSAMAFVAIALFVMFTDIYHLLPKSDDQVQTQQAPSSTSTAPSTLPTTPSTQDTTTTTTTPTDTTTTVPTTNNTNYYTPRTRSS